MTVGKGVSLILLLSITLILSVFMAEAFVFYGTNLDDTSSISRSISNSLDRYREELGLSMSRMDSTFSYTEEWDNFLDNLLSALHSEWREVSLLVPHLHEKNEGVAINLLFSNLPRLTLGLLNQPSISFFPLPTHNVASSYTSTQQLLIHLLRDWGDHGTRARHDTYHDGILRALDGYIHYLTTDTVVEFGGITPLRVLVPGAGMGRLAMELAASGRGFE